jgi:hypothetical protein
MSRHERYGKRSLVYSKWHRFYLGDNEPMIDIDAAEYCAERSCGEVLCLVETAMDVGQANKTCTVLRGLAQRSGVLALCVLYKVADGIELDHGCPCSEGAADDNCSHGITRFRVRKVWPQPPNSKWHTMTPEQYRDRLRALRMNHLADKHLAWEVA